MFWSHYKSFAAAAVRGGCCGLILVFASAGIAKAAPPGAGPGQEVDS